MLKTLITALTVLVLAACSPSAEVPSQEQSWQDALAIEGLAAAEANLQAGAQTSETQFLLGGVQFLRAAEAIMQVRYDNSTAPLAWVPGMRNRLPYNPDASFDPAFLEQAMIAALSHLDRAETTLAGMAGDDFVAAFPLQAIWFDVNANGTREDWESGLAVMVDLQARPDESFDGIVQFDTADAHWLKAYVHVMSGMAELTLAADPTFAIKTVYEGRRDMAAFGEVQGMFLDNEAIDMLATVLLTLRGTPDATRTQAAHQHFREMIAENRAFWAAVSAETDNDREWLPNPQQDSAFGVTVDAEMAASWQAVLLEIEEILDGDALIPYWRYNNGYGAETGVGVNLATYLQNPGDLDVILWLHGAGAAPYLETGKLAQLDAWDRFTQMTRGDGLMFAAWFN
ncbi:MAG: hypothetical protein AAFO74_10035 [Pseudomonadota bacterium]